MSTSTPRVDAVIATHRTVAFRPALVDITKDVVSGLVLSQILYWTPRATIHRDGRMWIAKAAGDWWDECRVTPHQARRALSVLQDLGVLHVRLWKWDGVPTTHFSIDADVLEQRLADLKPAHSDRKSIRADAQVQLGQSANEDALQRESLGTEMTSEMTSEKTPHVAEATESESETLSLQLVEAPPAVTPFEQFWNAYDKKTGKVDAVKAWNKARKTGADPLTLVEQAKAYRATFPASKKYMKDPARWLNAGGWMDELEPRELTLEEQREERNRRAAVKAAVEDERRARLVAEREAQWGAS